MSSFTSDEDKKILNENLPDELNMTQRINYLKERLFSNNIYEPIFLNYYKTKEGKNNFPEKNTAEIQLDDGLKKYYEELQEKEQIDDIKINLFFILKLKCDYNNEYNNILFQRYVKAKRLVIQHYSLKDDKIKFGPKEYSFIPVNNKDGDVFMYKGKKIEFIKKDKNGKKEYMIIDNKEIMTEKIFHQKYSYIKNLYDEEKEYKEAKCLSKNIKPDKNDKNDININKKKGNLFESKSDQLSEIKVNNKALSQIMPEPGLNYSSLSETSEKEIEGLKFFDENYRYIYKYYNKEIDGLYYSHPIINLNTKERKDLMLSLDHIYLNLSLSCYHLY